MEFQRILSYITGSVDEELRIRFAPGPGLDNDVHWWQILDISALPTVGSDPYQWSPLWGEWHSDMLHEPKPRKIFPTTATCLPTDPHGS